MVRDLFKNHKKVLAEGTFILMLYSALEIYQGILNGQIIDSAEGVIDTPLHVVFIRLGISWLLCFVFFWLFNYVNKLLIRNASARLKDKVLRSYLGQNTRQFYSSDTGEKISVLTNDISILENDFYYQVFDLVRFFFSMCFTLVVMARLSWKLTVIIVLVAIASFLVSRFVTKNLDKYKTAVSDASGEFVSRATEYFGGYSTIKAFNITELVSGMIYKKIADVKKKELKYDRMSISFSLIPYSMGVVTLLTCFMVGGYFVTKKQITSGELLTFINLVNNITMPIFMVIDITVSMKASKSIWQKIQNLAPVQEEQLQGLTVAKHDFTRSLDARGIKFGYGEKTVLDGISCSFEPGKKYLVVGLSGSGKSTFLKLLDRREVPNEGKLYMDGVDYNSIQESSLLDLVSFVEQQVFLFKGSLWDNITLYSKPKEDRVRELLCQVGLEYMQDSLYDNEFVSENGNSLSGGEKQRVSIARALLKGNKVLLADEVLASLDNENSQRIEKLLLELEGITVVSVSHRLNPDLLSRYHNILVFNKGHIVESGSYAELCGKKDSYLMRLVNIEEM